MALFKDVAGEYVQTCMAPPQIRHLIDRGLRIASAQRTVTCVIIPDDVQEMEYQPPERFGENDRKLSEHSLRFMRRTLEAAGARDIFETGGSAHLMGGCRMGFSAEDGVVDGNDRAFSCPYLWIADGSVMPTGGGVNPSMTIMANAARIADRLGQMAARGEA